MKKLLLILLCVPLIGLGQSKEIFAEEHIPQFIKIERIDGVVGESREINEGVYGHTPYKYNRYVYTKIDSEFVVYWYPDKKYVDWGYWRTTFDANYEGCGLIDSKGNPNPNLGRGLQYPGEGKSSDKFDGDKISRAPTWRMIFLDIE